MAFFVSHTVVAHVVVAHVVVAHAVLRQIAQTQDVWSVMVIVLLHHMVKNKFIPW